ncbi:MAG: DUF3078 domain-containing protein [Culturomica sp.]|jgi:hypothetical protein|nr:DUF3078 domain-containing protein [Culturomica sp.]
MKTKIILLLIVISLPFIGIGQTLKPNKDSTWMRGGLVSANFSQSSLTNWSAGGESALGLESMLAYEVNYKKSKNLWHNRFEFAYGVNHTDSDGTRKSNDKIYISSNYGYAMAKNLYASALMTFQTQFEKGYNYKVSDVNYISKFMAPGYLTIGAGATWTPKSWLTATLTPATWKGTFVTDDSLSSVGAYGVDKGDHLLSEFGANLKAEAKYEFLPNMTVYTRVNLYSNYLGKPWNIDVNWDVILNMKVNNWFSANVTTNLVYDDDQRIARKDGTTRPVVQFKEVLGVGLQLNF